MNSALLFPGQGAQYVGMGEDLYADYPEARRVYDDACKHLDYDIRDICFKGPDTLLKQTKYAQSAIFVTSMAALEVFRAHAKDLYLQIQASAGLSLGEATALTAAGAFTLDEGVQFVRDRGLFMDEASIEAPGSMAAILSLDLSVVEEICSSTGAEVGNLNCPGQVVISGKVDSVKEAISKCQEAGARRALPLDVSGAFHSSCMNSACDRIQSALESYDVKVPSFKVYSNLDAQAAQEPSKIKSNLIAQMNHRTLWELSMRKMIESGIDKFYEVGPGRVLKGLMKKIDSSVEVVSIGTSNDIQALLNLKQ